MASIQVGPIQDGKQSVTIGNIWAGGRAQTVISTPEQVDEFIKTHDETGKKAVKKSLLLSLGSSLAGLCIGALMKVKNAAKGTYALPGLAIGMISGGILGLIPAIKASVQQEKLAKNFIEENK